MHRFWVCRIPAVTESILRFHLTIGQIDLNDQSIIAEAPPQQAGIHPEQIRKAFPGAAEISLPCRFIHRAGVQALHRKGDTFCASVQQKHCHARRQPPDQGIPVLHRGRLCGQCGVLKQQCKHLFPGQLFCRAGRCAAAGGIQQQLPQPFQAGHSIKQNDGSFAVVKLKLLRIKICRSAKPSVELRKVCRQMAGKLFHFAAPFLVACPPGRRLYAGRCSGLKLLIFRTILIYLCVLFAMRLMGKRQLGELQPEELVSTILISNLASISIESEEVPVTASLIPLFLIAALELLGSILSFRSQRFFNLMSGRPKTVILNGEIDQNALRTLRLTAADLMEALRGKDVFDPRDVSYAVVETNGSLSVALRPEKEPATLADLGARVQRAQATIPFVLDGQVLAENLTICGKDAAWLERTAQANSLLLEEILILAGNDTEDYFLLKKEPRQTAGLRQGGAA